MDWSKGRQTQMNYHGQVSYTLSTTIIVNMSTRLYHLGNMNYNILIIINWSVLIRSFKISQSEFWCRKR